MIEQAPWHRWPRRSTKPSTASRRPTTRSPPVGRADRVQVDLGLLRDIGYYSGSILEVYDPTVGEVIGGGGRYDDLMSRFGVDLPAAGFTLYVERIHKAQLERGLDV